MNKKDETILKKVFDAMDKLTVALVEVFSSLESFRLAGLEQIKALTLMNENITSLRKTVESLNVETRKSDSKV